MIGRFILRRLAVSAAQLAGITIVVFVIIRLLPADPAAQSVGMNASHEAYLQARHALGLDQPLWRQFADFAGIPGLADKPGLLEGSLGKSWVTSQSVVGEIATDLPVTLEVVTLSLLLAFAIALPLGLASARRPKGFAGRIALVWGLFAGGQPDYWWGLLFIFVFFYKLGIAPAPMGRISPLLDAPPFVTGSIIIDSLLAGDLQALLSGLQYLALPVLTLVFVISGALVKMVRTNTVRALRSDYILYARAIGLPERVIGRYALRAALTPAITLVGIFYSVLLSAAVTIEIVFSLNGIGQYSVRSVLAFDYPAIQGTVLVVAMVSLMIYLLLDIVHAWLDPRIRH
jgi:peptide/nickel transport system permease protein